MRTRRRTLLATGLVAVLTVAGITAALANDPPPRIAFLANGIVPADALAAGPIAGQLGAPIFTTGPDALIDSTADALANHDPELVVVMGGPAAISDAVLAQVSEATGLSVVAPTPPPANGIVRAAGADRFETAAAAAALLGAYDPAYLPTSKKAADSDLLDGKDSTAFLGKADQAADSDALDGLDLTEVQFPTVVPSGVTIVGRWGFDGVKTGIGNWGGQISYPVPLPGTPTTHYVREGATAVPGCPGTVADPRADPGFLCIYEDALVGTADGFPSIRGSSRYGLNYYFRGDGNTGGIYGYGTWAATAAQSGGGAPPVPGEK